MQETPGEKTKEFVDQHKYIAHIRPRGEDRAQAQSKDPKKQAAPLGRRTTPFLAQPFTQDPGPLGKIDRDL